MTYNMATHRNSRDGPLLQESQVLNNPDVYLGHLSVVGPTAHIYHGVNLSINIDFGASFLKKFNNILGEWKKIRNLSVYTTVSSSIFVKFLQTSKLGLLIKHEASLDAFLRYCIRRVIIDSVFIIDQSQKPREHLKQRLQNDSDYVTKLVTLLIINEKRSKRSLVLLDKVLGLILGYFKDQNKQNTLNPKPYDFLIKQLLYIYWGKNAPSTTQLVTSFSHVMRILNPNNYPGFAMTWLSLMEHKKIIGNVARSRNEETWRLYGTLLLDLFKYLSPLISETTDLKGELALFYNGVIDFLKELHSNYSEILSSYYLVLDEVLPKNCVIIRSIILSATPPALRDMCKQICFTETTFTMIDPYLVPRIDLKRKNVLPPAFKHAVDTFLSHVPTELVMDGLIKKLQVPHVPGEQYKVPLVNALVIYLCYNALDCLIDQRLIDVKTFLLGSSHLRIMKYLMEKLNEEGSLKIQIIRMLIERLCVKEYQQWGVAFTLSELTSNSDTEFWRHSIYDAIPHFERYIISLTGAVTFKENKERIHEFNPEQYFLWEKQRPAFIKSIENKTRAI